MPSTTRLWSRRSIHKFLEYLPDLTYPSYLSIRKNQESVLLTTQVFCSFSDYVMRNAAVSSSSITKSHLVISWPARKLVPSLDFWRCVSLVWVASSSLLKLNKSSYKSMMTYISSCDKWTLYNVGIKIYFIWDI